jgi:hypothetical protein
MVESIWDEKMTISAMIFNSITITYMRGESVSIGGE